MRRSSRAALLTVTSSLVAFSIEARAEDAQITAEARIEPPSFAPGQRGRVIVDIAIPDGYHLWSLDPGPGPQALTLALAPAGSFRFDGPWRGTEPKMVLDRGFQRELAEYEGRAHLERAVVLERSPSDGSEPAKLLIRGQICDPQQCLPQKLDVKLAVAFSDVKADFPAVEPAGIALTERSASSKTAPPSVAAGGLEAAKAQGILSFLLLAFVFGLGALATPCVFPAIPLTVSFFSKYSKESFGRGARLAAVYAMTMVATFTIAGILVSVFFGVTGIQRFAAHPIFNLLLGLMLVFFSLNLLGLFEITVPASMLSIVNRIEARWGRNAMVEGAPSGGVTDYIVVAVAAVTATTVFFTCTVAFVGLVLVAAARGEWFWPTIGMLAFSSAFALPFFLLAMFPQGAYRLRGKAGGWMNATRVTLGFFELAAATKFISNADLVWSMKLLTRDVVLAFWIPLFALAGLYLLGKIKMGEEPHEAEGRVSVLRVLASTAMFALAIYLTAGFFNARSFGGWIDGWLPPVDYPGMAPVARGANQGPGEGGLVWKHDLEEARAIAREKGTLVFANYTGYTCTNCRYMEGALFPMPAISELLRKMTLAELYTDGGTPNDEKNRDDQVARFKTAALPLYVVERPDGTVLGTFASSTNDPAEFKRFLEEAMSRAGATDVAPPPLPPIASAPAAGDEKLVLATTRLADGQKEVAIAPGKWTLINFWATYCGPCVEELRSFLIDAGRDLEAKGGRFVLIAVEADTEGSKKALEYTKQWKLPPASALALPFDFSDKEVDPRLQFDGNLPYTVLVAPNGEIVWMHRTALTREALRAKVGCFLDPAMKLARKC